MDVRKLNAAASLINHEAERLVIGNILADSTGAFARLVIPKCEAEYFSTEDYRRIFVMAREMHADGISVSLSAFYEKLIADQKSNLEMGLPTLSDLAWSNQIEILEPDLPRYIAELRRKHRERCAWRAAESLRGAIETGSTAEELERLTIELRRLQAAQVEEAPNETIAGGMGSIDRLLSAPPRAIDLPYTALTELTNGGLQNSELWIVAARPGDGKSTLALQTAVCAASQGHKTLFCSLEMTKDDLNQRLLSAEGNIPLDVLKRGNLMREFRRVVAETLARVGEYPLIITSEVRTLSDLLSKVAATKDLAFVVVDYLGLLRSGQRLENRTQEVSAVSRALKLLAMDHNIPVLAAHQLNRANQTESRRPQLSDLRDSGSIEQDADVVIMLDAPGSRKGSDVEKNVIDLQIAKQRRGVRNVAIRLYFEGRFCRMRENSETLGEYSTRQMGLQ